MRMTPSHRDRVLPEWVDANGHMNLAYYVLVFDRATDKVFDELGVGHEYRRTANRALFAVETHTLYEQELREGASVEVRTTVVAADGKRLHLAHEMYGEGAQGRAAAQELMYLHVDLGTRRSAPFTDDAAARLHAAADAVRSGARPDWLGRRVRLPG